MKKGFGVIFEFEVLKTLWWYDYDIWMSWHTVWHKYIWQGKILMNQSCIVKTFPINTLHLEYKNLCAFAYNLSRACIPIEWPCLCLISHNQTTICIEFLYKQPDHECCSLFRCTRAISRTRHTHWPQAGTLLRNYEKCVYWWVMLNSIILWQCLGVASTNYIKNKFKYINIDNWLYIYVTRFWKTDQVVT